MRVSVFVFLRVCVRFVPCLGYPLLSFSAPRLLCWQFFAMPAVEPLYHETRDTLAGTVGPGQIGMELWLGKEG